MDKSAATPMEVEVVEDECNEAAAVVQAEEVGNGMWFRRMLGNDGMTIFMGRREHIAGHGVGAP